MWSEWIQHVKWRDRKEHKKCGDHPMHPQAGPTTVRICPHGIVYDWHRGGWREAYPWSIRGGIYNW